MLQQLDGERHAHLVKLSIKQSGLLEAVGLTMNSRKIAEKLEMWEIFGQTWIPALPQQHPLTLLQGQGLIFRKSGVKDVPQLDYYIQLTLPAFVTDENMDIPAFITYAASSGSRSNATSAPVGGRGWQLADSAAKGEWKGSASRRAQAGDVGRKRGRALSSSAGAMASEDDDDDNHVAQRRRLWSATGAHSSASRAPSSASRAPSSASRAPSRASRASWTSSGGEGRGSAIEITDDEESQEEGGSCAPGSRLPWGSGYEYVRRHSSPPGYMGRRMSTSSRGTDIGSPIELTDEEDGAEGPPSSSQGSSAPSSTGYGYVARYSSPSAYRASPLSHSGGPSLLSGPSADDLGRRKGKERATR